MFRCARAPNVNGNSNLAGERVRLVVCKWWWCRSLGCVCVCAYACIEGNKQRFDLIPIGKRQGMYFRRTTHAYTYKPRSLCLYLPLFGGRSALMLHTQPVGGATGTLHSAIHVRTQREVKNPIGKIHRIGTLHKVICTVDSSVYIHSAYSVGCLVKGVAFFPVCCRFVSFHLPRTQSGSPLVVRVSARVCELHAYVSVPCVCVCTWCGDGE